VSFKLLESEVFQIESETYHKKALITGSFQKCYFLMNVLGHLYFKFEIILINDTSLKIFESLL
jgi:hypothetical protein